MHTRSCQLDSCIKNALTICSRITNAAERGRVLGLILMETTLKDGGGRTGRNPVPNGVFMPGKQGVSAGEAGTERALLIYGAAAPHIRSGRSAYQERPLKYLNL